ncbi:MAG: MFS transporter [Rhodospirillales bacterium]|nr:MFS transporter [Rhodospirillales bacterium]
MAFPALPAWLGAPGRISIAAFLILFSLESGCRAIAIAVVPIEALSRLGDAQKVSLLYFCVSSGALFTSLLTSAFVRWIGRRGLFSLGTVSFMASGFLYTVPGVAPFAAALALQVFATLAIEMTLNLFLLDNVRRQEMGRFEPLRIFWIGSSWIACPWLGIYLQKNVHALAPYAIIGASALLLLAFFWMLRPTESTVLPAEARPPVNPIVNLPRFIRQPRLVLAWVLAVGRHAFWIMFFVYAPIYAVTSGLGELAGGLIVSLGTAWLVTVPFLGRLGRKHGFRRLLMLGFVLAGVFSIVAAAVAGLPWLGAAALVVAALGGIIIDSGGNVHFLRAVHARERAEMTAVFATFRYTAQLLPPGLFSLILFVYELPAVFVLGGVLMLVMAFYCRYLPRRL